MNKLKDWIINRTVGPVWNALDGKKTTIAAVAGALTGLGGLVIDALPAISSHSPTAVIAFVQTIPSNPHWLTLIASLGALGMGHKIDKNTAAVAASGEPVKE